MPKVKKSGEHPVAESRNKLYQKRLHPASKDVIIKDVLVNETKEPARPSTGMAEPTYRSNVVCEAGKSSGWLHCEDITGVYKFLFKVCPGCEIFNLIYLFTGNRAIGGGANLSSSPSETLDICPVKIPSNT